MAIHGYLCRAKHKTLRLLILMGGFAAAITLLQCRPSLATYANIDFSQYTTRSCSTSQTVLYYKNQFGMCFDNFQSTVSTADPQSTCNIDGISTSFAVGTTPGSTDIVNWTAIPCNGTFTPTFATNMIPGSTYYLAVNHNGSVATLPGTILENQAPTLSNSVPANQWYNTSPGTSLVFTFQDNTGTYSGGRLKDCSYIVYPQAGKTGAPVINTTSITTNLNAGQYAASGVWSVPWGSLQSGNNYFSFSCNDYAGNSANFTDSFNIKKDISAPTHAIVAPPQYVNTGLTYSLRWAGDDTAVGTPSGISCFRFQYRDTTTSGSWTDAASPACQIPSGSIPPDDYHYTFSGIEGHRFEFRVQAQDTAGNTDSFDADNTFFTTFDTIKPTSTVTNPPVSVNTSPFAVSWSGNDSTPGSGIAGFNVQFKAGAAGTWTDWRVGTPGTTNTTENFSGTDGTQYFFRVQAQDNAANTEATYGTPSSGVLVDLTLPTSSVNALPAYTTSANFNVTWTGNDTSGGTPSGVNCYDVQYSKDGGAWTAWQSCTTSVSASFTSTGNGTYSFRSRAKDNAGNWENWPGSADAQTIVDTTPPTFTSVNDGPGTDISFSASNNTIEANWAANDTDSSTTGITRYDYAIGTTSGGTDIADWTTVGTNTSVSRSGLTLTHNTVYYVTIRAYNAAGLFTDQPSNGVKTDLMPPTTSMSAPNSPYMGTTDFNVAWSGTDGAAESGLNTYTVEYKAGAGSWAAWQTNTTSTSGTFNGTNGFKYQFRVIAKDAVGNTTPYPTSPDYQVETTVDTSNLPSPSNISEGTETDPDADFTSNTSSFSGHWDAVSGAASYYYAIGTTSGGTDIVNWTETTSTSFTKTGLTLSDGATYFLSVKAKNFSAITGYTGLGDGITVDLTAPGCSVTALATYQGTAQFSVQWNTSGPDASGIKNYDIQVKDGTGAWTDWLTASALTSSLYPGANGHTYAFQCRATDNAGNTGTYPGGAGDTSTTVDTSILNPPATINDGTAADLYFTTDAASLSANWTAVTGASSYVLCFGEGAVPNNCNIMDWTDVGTAVTYTKTGLSLTDGQTYFARIKCKNFSNIEGAPGNSDGVTLDANPPGTPAVTDEGAFTRNTSSLYASWSSTPGNSGIAEYQYAVGTTSGGTEALNWTSNGIRNDATISGLSLSNATTYYISVKAKAGSGAWSAVGAADGILIDTAAPTCAVQALAPYQANTSFALTWSASDSGAGVANLYDVQYRDGAAGVWTDWLVFNSLTTKNFNGIDGHDYGFRCRAMDNAGNWSTYPGTPDATTIVNASAPAAPVVSDGAGADVQFTTSPDTLAANWAAITGAAGYAYAIGTTPGGTDLVNWTDSAGTSFSASPLALVNGTKYYVSVKARNNAAVEGAAGTSDGVTVDTTPPDAPSVFVPDTVTASTNFLEASWTAADTESGITEYSVSVGTTPGGTDTKDWFSAGLSTSVSIPGLTMTHGTSYYINVKATNGVAMTSSAGSSPAVLVNTTLLPGPATVSDGTGADAQFSNSATTLSANWAAVTDALSYDYAIGSTPGARNVLDWTNNGTNTSVTNSALTLTSGTTYYFSVRSRNSADVPGVAKVSNGILVDTQLPSTPAVSDEGDYSLTSAALTATWTASTAVSGISAYAYAIGTTAGGNDIKDWTSSGASTRADITGLSLAQGGPYYISVKSTSNAGNESAAGTSNGITVDSVAPTCTVQSLPAYQASSVFTVVWAGADSGTGIAPAYDIQVRDGQTGTWANWLSASALTTSDYLGADTHTYFFRCRAKDNAGNYSTLPDNPDTSTIIDRTPPASLTVSDGTADDTDYTAAGDTLSANWAADPRAAAYSYAIGSTSGGADIVNWTEITATTFTATGLSLTNGARYYTSVKARNNAGLFGPVATSDGILVDTTAPTTPSVSRPDQFTNSATSLSANWSSADTESGISEFQLSVGTTAGGTDTKDWYSVDKTMTSTIINGLSLTNGGTYYVNVRAKNNAGTLSSAGSTPGTTVDTTLLPAPASINDGAGPDIDYTSNATTLSANWSPVQGVAKYQYAIGTASGLRDVLAWTDNGTDTLFSKSGLTLTNGTKYFVDVRGVNNAGTPGAAGSSDGLVVDNTAPEKPAVTDAGDRVNADEPLTASWSASDAQSPIVKYEYSIGTSAGTQNIKDWTDAGTDTAVTEKELKLKVAETYYFTVRATNSSGLVSETGSSDGIKAVMMADVAIRGEENEAIEFNVDNIKPIATANPPEGNGEFKITKKFNFVEKKGVGVNYDRLQRTFVLEDDTQIDEPEQSISLQIVPGSELKQDLELVIPPRIIQLAMGGRASAIVTLKYVYTGLDQSNNLIKTTLLLPVKLTSSIAEAEFKVTSAIITAPKANAKLSKGGGNIAKATVKLNGIGTLNGIWMLDGEFYKAYKQDVSGVTEVEVTQALPATLDGAHKLQFRVTMPEVRDSEVVDFTVSEGAAADNSISDFWAGAVHVSGIDAAFDPVTQTYTGKGTFKLPLAEEDITIEFKRLKIDKQGDKNILTRGIIALQLERSFTRGPLTIALSKLYISTDTVAADGSVSFAGTDSLPEIGPFYFYSAGITEGGIKAAIKLGSPQKGRIGFFELGITDIFFAYDSAGITLKAGGYITTQPQDILKLYLYFGYTPGGAVFDYSVTKKDNWVISTGTGN